MTLLEQAKNAAARRSSVAITQEIAELVVAWANSEISTGQATKVLGKHPAGMNSYLSLMLARAARAGLVEVKLTNHKGDV